MKDKYLFPLFNIRPFLFLLLLMIVSLSSCKKYLEAKSDQSISTPSTITDLEGIIDNYAFMNTRYPSASEVSSDSYYLTDPDWATLTDRQRNFYLWQKTDDIGGDYTSAYSSVAYANVILETLPKVLSNDAARNNTVKGSALFIRASCHFALAQLFSPAYDPGSANDGLGIAIRLTADAEAKPVRSSVSDTYASVVSDLKSSAALLPSMPVIRSRPGKASAYGMLARVYLSMGDYTHAGLYADSCLKIYNTLIDYNSISTTAAIPFKQFNDEVIYDAKTSPPSALTATKAKIDTVLYSLYNANDLRKVVFFKSNTNGTKAFKGNYTGLSNASVFTGVASDEIYLIKAECAARTGDVQSGLQFINQLLVNRWKKGTYASYTTTDAKLLTSIILQERKKELLFRSLRWIDLRRLNKEKDYAQNIYRRINSVLYTLDPSNVRYVFEIDKNAITISGLQQNP